MIAHKPGHYLDAERLHNAIRGPAEIEKQHAVVEGFDRAFKSWRALFRFLELRGAGGQPLAPVVTCSTICADTDVLETS